MEFHMTKNYQEENYQKFLKGVFFIKGWRAREKEILQFIPDHDKPEMEKFLSELGEKIGREWSKDTRVRKINSGMLQKWGKQLKEAVAVDPENLVARLKIIDHEVNKIISNNA
jgi:regulator of sirC expression with transglutaminase-like and TPR domain